MSQETEDIESKPHVPGRPDGYGRLAGLMGIAPEMAIVRRFGDLSMLDILHRQAELHELAITFRSYQKEDKESGHPDRQRYDLDWDALQRSVDDAAPDGNDGAQWETALELRQKLKEYQEALLRYRQVLDLGPPIPRQLKSLNKWMSRPDMGNVFLEGSDRHIWTDESLKDDLIALAGAAEVESFTNPFTLWATRIFHRLIGKRIFKSGANDSVLRNTIRYTNTGTFRAFRTISTIVACLLPVASIAVLNAIQSMPGRIGAIAGFTAVFSLCLSMITSATVKDIFVATTTFAAVLVVFVGTTESHMDP